jgi:hypothetical protein
MYSLTATKALRIFQDFTIIITKLFQICVLLFICYYFNIQADTFCWDIKHLYSWWWILKVETCLISNETPTHIALLCFDCFCIYFWIKCTGMESLKKHEFNVFLVQDRITTGSIRRDENQRGSESIIAFQNVLTHQQCNKRSRSQSLVLFGRSCPEIRGL